MWARERLVPVVRSIQVYYASVFCHNNHCLCYFFWTRIYPSPNLESLEYHSCPGVRASCRPSDPHFSNGVLALLNTTGRLVLKSTGRDCQDKKPIAGTSDWHAAVGILNECLNVTDTSPRTSSACLGLPLAAVVGLLTLGDIPEQSSTWGLQLMRIEIIPNI